jgi:hypothetical protein
MAERESGNLASITSNLFRDFRMMRFLPNIKRKPSTKGSALLTALFLVLFLSFLAYMLLELNVRGSALVGLRETDDRNYWIAAGAENIALERLGNSGFPDTEMNLDGRIGPWPYSARLVRDRRGYGLSVRTRTGRQDREMTVPLDMESYADYTLVYNGDLRLVVPEGRQVILNGPILVNGTLHLAVEGSLRIIASHRRVPLLSCTGLSSSNRPGSRGEVILEDASVGSGYRVSLIRDGKLSETVREGFVREIPRRSIVTLKGILESLSAKPGCIRIDSDSWHSKKKILNPALLEKDFIGIVSGSRPEFNIHGRDSLESVYFSGDPDARVINPLVSADSLDGRKDFLFGEGRLSFPRQERKITLRPEDCRIFGVFEYGLPETSASSIYRSISDVRINGVRQVEGRDIEIDRKARRIIVFRPDFAGEFARGDGRTTSFQAPEGFGASSVVFLDRRRMTEFKFVSGKLEFSLPPASGSRLTWYKRIPEISFVKEDPLPGTAVFIDKEVTVDVVDLDRVSYPSGSVLIFTGPILVRGKTSKALTIVTPGDIYLGNLSSVKGLVLYGRLAWIVSRGRESVLENVFVFSEGESIYPREKSADQVTLSGSLVLRNEKGSLPGGGRSEPLVWNYGKIPNPVEVHLDAGKSRFLCPLFIR